MIKALRVDERLIHGQIAMLWSKELKIDGIVVANDSAANDEMQKMVLKMAVPDGLKVIIKSVPDAIKLLHNPKAQDMKLLVIVRTIQDAVIIARENLEIEYVNLGNVGKTSSDQTKALSKNVMVTTEEMDSLRDLVKLYPKTGLQVVPTEPIVLADKFI